VTGIGVTSLVSLLQTGNMDYAREYRSVGVQHELKFVEVRDQIDLKNYSYNNFCKKAVLEFTGNTLGRIVVDSGL
jgi:molybdate/tungstate transport system substrate-binding protein